MTRLVTVCDHKLKVFENSPKLTFFGIFYELVTKKCNSLRSQYWKRLFLWFSNTVKRLFVIVFAHKSRLFMAWKVSFILNFYLVVESQTVSKLKYMAPFSDGKDAINNSKAFQNVIELQKRWRAAQLAEQNKVYCLSYKLIGKRI